jgi:acyl carrier protein
VDRETIRARLTAIFRQIFDDQALVLSDTLTAADVRGWDSLSHINLILAVERSFEVRMSTREIRSMRNVGDMIMLLEKKVA